MGTFDSWEAWAYDFVESTGLLHGVPDTLKNYFDYAAYGRDASMSDMFESEGHYFSAH